MKNKKKKTTLIWLLIVSAAIFAAGIACLAVKAFTPEWIDSSGILHESFFLLPLGFGGIFGGLIVFIIWLILMIIRRKKAE